MRAGRRGSCVLAAAMLATALAMAPARAHAQNTTLTVAGGPVAFPTPTSTDLNLGYVNAPAPLTFTVDATSGAASQQRTTTVYISGATATLGGTKPIGDLQYSVSSPGSWQSLTTTAVRIAGPTVVARNRMNDTWGGTVYFRMLVAWTDAPGTYSGTVVVTMTVSQP